MLILVSTVTGFILTSPLASLDCVFVAITRSAVGLKICAITAGIKKYKSIIKKKKNNHDKIILFGKSWIKYYSSFNF